MKSVAKIKVGDRRAVEELSGSRIERVAAEGRISQCRGLTGRLTVARRLSLWSRLDRESGGRGDQTTLFWTGPH